MVGRIEGAICLSYNVQPARNMFRRIRALKMSISNALCARLECARALEIHGHIQNTSRSGIVSQDPVELCLTRESLFVRPVKLSVRH